MTFYKRLLLGGVHIGFMFTGGGVFFNFIFKLREFPNLTLGDNNLVTMGGVQNSELKMVVFKILKKAE